jgi:CubicO group peptidase (beta-lactamase class C family)
MAKQTNIQVSGFVKPGFEPVWATFNENFSNKGELGASCCIYYQGEKVVDLWGGVRNKTTGDPWEENTMALVFSTTKGMSAMAIALAHSRGWLDYEETVCAYWPEFAQQGKDKITIRQLLGHQAGLFALDAIIDRSVVTDLDRLAEILANQKPAWKPGTRQAYHAFSLGFYEGELLRRVDPQHRSLGKFFQDEIALPLGLDFYIRLPENIQNSQLAIIQKANVARMLVDIGSFSLLLAFMNKRPPTRRAVFENPGPWLPLDKDRIYARNLGVPSGGGVGTARAIAQAYSVFATAGHELGLRPETLQCLSMPPISPQRGFYDEVMKREMAFSLGFMKPSRAYPFGSHSAFGASGSGGSFGFGDPQKGIGYAYVPNQMGSKQGGEPRDLAIRSAFFRSIKNG